MSKAFYDKYHSLKNEKVSLRYDLLKRLAEPLIRGKKVFEVGCGCGEIASLLALAARSWTGIDLSPVAIKKAKEGRITANFITGDFMEIPEGEGDLYDTVCFFDSLEHFPDWREALDKGVNLMKIGGHIIINIPAPNWTKWVSSHKSYLPDYREQEIDHQIELKEIINAGRTRGLEVLLYQLYKCDVPQQYQFIVLGSKIEWEILNEGIKSNAVQEQLAAVL